MRGDFSRVKRFVSKAEGVEVSQKPSGLQQPVYSNHLTSNKSIGEFLIQASAN